MKIRNPLNTQDRRREDKGPDARANKDLDSDSLQMMEQCAEIVGNQFCGFYFGKHVGSFLHEFKRPPLSTGDLECAICGNAACRGVKMVYIVLLEEPKREAYKGYVACEGCAKPYPTIQLRHS